MASAKSDRMSELPSSEALKAVSPNGCLSQRKFRQSFLKASELKFSGVEYLRARCLLVPFSQRSAVQFRLHSRARTQPMLANFKQEP